VPELHPGRRSPLRVLHGPGRAGVDRLSLLAAAARNNADWCDAVCRRYGIDGRFEPDCWSSPQRTPPLYPDAVTLAPGVSAGLLLARVDAGAGCSIKDSFDDVDVAAEGFRPLFRAEWVAWTDPLPGRGDDERAVATCSAGVIGLTNVTGDDFAASWLGAAAAAQARWGPLPVVGYETGDALEALRSAGVRSLGALTVWTKGTAELDAV
jgi:hypothetical protein